MKFKALLLPLLPCSPRSLPPCCPPPMRSCTKHPPIHCPPHPNLSVMLMIPPPPLGKSSGCEERVRELMPLMDPPDSGKYNYCHFAGPQCLFNLVPPIDSQHHHQTSITLLPQAHPHPSSSLDHPSSQSCPLAPSLPYQSKRTDARPPKLAVTKTKQPYGGSRRSRTSSTRHRIRIHPPTASGQVQSRFTKLWVVIGTSKKPTRQYQYTLLIRALGFRMSSPTPTFPSSPQ